MSNPFDPPQRSRPEKSSVPSSNSDPFDSSTASQQAGSSSQSFASPPGIPPNHPSTAQPAAATTHPMMDVNVPDEPPPAYTSAPGPNTIQTGPQRMDFSGPPPMPDRFNHDRPQIEQQITGVGYGYRHDPIRDQPTGYAMGTQPTGYAPPSAPPPQKSYGDGKDNGEKPLNTQPTGPAGPSRPPDLSPTEIATPGRPLLRKGQLLVYPKNHYCQKCGNTGYKNNDPNNPHDTDWRKYGKPYNSALQASYKSSTDPFANGQTQSSSNFQKPLPDLRPPQGQGYGHGYGYGHGPGQGSNGGQWNQHPGNHAPRPPPPGQGWQIQQHQQTWNPLPPHVIQHNPIMGGPRLGGGIVVKPGDPRIGGKGCWKCGGEGRALSFFGFDDGPCRECRGVGRLFF